MIVLLLFLAAFFLAYSNGANDNFKGVATLFGSGTTDYRKALWWGTGTTFLGSIAAIALAGTLVSNFSGRGLIPDALLLDPRFALSVAFGAGTTVFLATWIGMPISTTHALVGSLAGSGLVAAGPAFDEGRLVQMFLLPLIVSPLLAATISLVAYLFFRKMRLSLGVEKETCLCIPGETAQVLIELPGGKLAREGNGEPHPIVSTEEECREIYTGRFLGVSAQAILNAAHYFSAGVVSFARGLNDAPKIVGLLLVAGAFDISWGLLAIGVAMALGGVLNAERVAETMSRKITPMNDGQGFTANLVTGLLVTTASIHGLPVSTTHVSVGSLFGIGAATGEGSRKTARAILLSWVVTLPLAAILAGTGYLLSSGVD
ncbi:MAG: inorganic phosphate transporter [Ignavibacteria bacterium]|nr:inorganic phosphate transporter [Ignavibacteria bacterium]